MKWGAIFIFILAGIIFLFVILFLIRAFSEKQLDDVSPGIQCDKRLLEKADKLFIIPKFNDKNISEDKQWCKEILSLNKKLALHGVYHTYNEFGINRNEEYLEKGVLEFKSCFNQTPSEFKPPYLIISRNNKKLIKKYMKLDLYFNQIFHKVYHCKDTGKFSNRFINWF